MGMLQYVEKIEKTDENRADGRVRSEQHREKDYRGNKNEL